MGRGLIFRGSATPHPKGRSPKFVAQFVNDSSAEFLVANPSVHLSVNAGIVSKRMHNFCRFFEFLVEASLYFLNPVTLQNSKVNPHGDV